MNPEAARLPAVGPGGVFRRRLIAKLSVLSLPPIALMTLYVLALVRLPPDHLRVFVTVTATIATLLFPFFLWMYHRLYAGIVAALDGLAEGRVTREEVVVAFRTLTALPAILFRRSLAIWSGAGLACVVVTALLTEGMGGRTLFSLFAGVLSGGFVISIFLSLAAKRIVEPERLQLAAVLGDPELRETSVETMPLAQKMQVSLVGVTLVTLVFAILLAQVRASAEVEGFVSELQAVLLARAGDSLGATDLAALRDEARALGAASELVLVSPGGEVVWGPSDLLAGVEARAAAGASTGNGTGFDSPNAFSWRRLRGGHTLVAVLPEEALHAHAGSSRIVFALVLVGSAALAWLAAWLLADDVTRASAALRRQAHGIAEGDLSAVEVFDSEDELGALGRAFDRMRAGLRTLAAGVADTAGRVEEATAGLGAAADQVGDASAEQASALEGAGASVAQIQEGARGIAEAADALGRAIEESTSSAQELGAVGGELSDTAGSLAGKVDTVSSAVEEMAASVREVAGSTDALADAAAETSSSMEEMAATVREAETHAEETSRLSRSVVGAAELGRERVAQTISGMETIQEETETARAVIGSLGQRATEIGSILEVITEVADETSLLALNAAIISAQAGEHGRAFAVVAGQIRDLADRVLQSTREIEERVRAVQAETRNAVGAIERGAQSVERGVELSAEAGMSLEEITGAARESGGRIDEIVAAVREQSKSAAHVVGLMERLQEGLERIRRASREQDRGNELILNEVVDMRHAADRVSATTREQQSGAGRIRDAFERVGSAVGEIRQAIGRQIEACDRAAALHRGMREGTRSNEGAATRVAEASSDLRRRAVELREDVRRFRLEDRDDDLEEQGSPGVASSLTP